VQSKPRVLFVDDEERVVNLLRMMFRASYEVHTATSGAQALEIAAAQPIDVIVSDQRMPGMTGIELLAEMRKRSPATMRILLTGYSDLTAIVGSVNDGEVFRFINKPWDNEEIKRIVAEAAEAALATAAVAAVPPQPGAQMQAQAGDASAMPGVLLIDDDPRDRQAIAASIGNQLTVHSADDISTALRVLEKQDIGVIVSEAHVGGQDVGELLRILKRHHPAVTTVMLTTAADADHIIKLINGAQIFRFGTKPIRASSLRLAVVAAMREHKRLCANPLLMRRHRVEEMPGEPGNASLVSGVLSSLTRMRARFGRMIGLAH
jgi:serine/threonine-protein kinase